MDERVERRSPDRHQFALRLLRRLAIFCLAVALALWAVPRLLVELGVMGPTAEDRIGEAKRAIAAARAYGAGTDTPPLHAAEQGVARAGALAAGGHEREARREAIDATSAAVEAQKLALVARSGERERAEAVYNDLDRQIGDLEKLYDAVTPGLPREQTSRLLSVMKVTRQSAGVLFLAYEKEEYAAVVEGEARARAAVDNARRTLESARKRQER
jgi:hypothetical protein